MDMMNANIVHQVLISQLADCLELLMESIQNIILLKIIWILCNLNSLEIVLIKYWQLLICWRITELIKTRILSVNHN